MLPSSSGPSRPTRPRHADRVRMLAVVLEAPGRLVARAVDEPGGDGLVTVRVEQVGVCGTDRNVVDGAIPVSLPRIIGHELVGRVVSGGGLPGAPAPGAPAPGAPAPGALAPGDRVLIDPSLSCGACRTCRRGMRHLCPSGGLMGRDVDGGLAELVAVEAERLHRLPASMGLDDAALLQVLGTCVHAQRQAPLFPTDRAVVVGLGVSGLLHVQLLRARGARAVVGIGRSPEKRALAEALGATATCAPDDALGVVGEVTTGDGAELVVEAVGTPGTVTRAVALAGYGATLVVFGTASGAGQVPLYEMYHKELTVLHPRAALGEDYDHAIDLIAAGAVRGAPLVSDRLSFTDAPATLSDWAAHPERLKVVFEP